MTSSDLELFNDSLSRCVADPRFMEHFYDLFLASSAEVRDKFRGTDLHKQRRVLKASLYMVMLAIDGNPDGLSHLDRIARLHGEAGMRIGPHLYDLWLEALIGAAREADRRFDAETERVWRATLAFGIDYMRTRYADRGTVERRL
jgi:hemoglobin-like flavoprotein